MTGEVSGCSRPLEFAANTFAANGLRGSRLARVSNYQRSKHEFSEFN